MEDSAVRQTLHWLFWVTEAWPSTSTRGPKRQWSTRRAWSRTLTSPLTQPLTVPMDSRQPCRFWLRGECTFGDRCRNSHQTHAVLVTEIDRQHAPVLPKRSAVTMACPYFSKGICKFGDQCHYSHLSRPELPSPDGEASIDQA